MNGPLVRLSVLAWLPLVAALAVAAAFSRAIVAVALQGPGGALVRPADHAIPAPAAARVREVRRPRAPDHPESGRAR